MLLVCYKKFQQQKKCTKSEENYVVWNLVITQKKVEICSLFFTARGEKKKWYKEYKLVSITQNTSKIIVLRNYLIKIIWFCVEKANRLCGVRDLWIKFFLHHQSVPTNVMDATSIITSVSPDDEQLNVCPDKGKYIFRFRNPYKSTRIFFFPLSKWSLSTKNFFFIYLRV